jgi:hypothetical protein
MLQIVKPLAPFIIASAITWYGVNVAQTAAVNSEYTYLISEGGIEDACLDEVIGCWLGWLDGGWGQREGFSFCFCSWSHPASVHDSEVGKQCNAVDPSL